MIEYFVMLLVAINAMTFVQFARDKRLAVQRKRRIPEAHLLNLAFVGGTPAAFAARHLFCHKTRKEPFSTRLMIIAMVQAGALIGLTAAKI